MKRSSADLHDEAQVLRCTHKDLRGALNLYRSAYRAAEVEGDRFHAFHNRVHVADCLFDLGDLEGAARALIPIFDRKEEELPLHDEVADACRRLIEVQLCIPTDLRRIQRLVQRLEPQENAQGLNGDRRMQGSALTFQARIAELQGRWSDAMALTLEALARKELEYRSSAVLDLVRQCTFLGRFEQAAVYLADWERLERNPETRRGFHVEDRIGLLLAKSKLARAQRSYDEALAHAEAAAALAETEEDEGKRQTANITLLTAALSCRSITLSRGAGTALLPRRRAQSLLERYRVFCALGDLHIGAMLIQLGKQPLDYEFQQDEAIQDVPTVDCPRAWRLYMRAAKLAHTIDHRLDTDLYTRAIGRRVSRCLPLTRAVEAN